MTRDERQEIARQKWIKAQCKGTIVAGTGFGKSYTAIKCIKSFWNKYPHIRFLVVVPTDNLKVQWQSYIDNNGLTLNGTVEIINTVIKRKYDVDILCIDEIHITPANTFKKVFECVRYKFILGLTATYERLDGKEILIDQYCPVIDSISVEEAVKNGWLSTFTEYQILLDVDDLDVYKQYTKEFTASFEFFNYDWSLASSMVGSKGYINRIKYRDLLCPNGDDNQKSKVLKQVTYHATAFMRAVQNRKKFINNHPKKLEIAREIIEARSNSKIITFSNNIKMAEAVGIGKVYTGRESKKQSRISLEEFNDQPIGVINSCKKLVLGADIKGLSVAIMLGIDSSELTARQKLGRCIRVEPNKHAEIFNLIINNTVETEWMKKSHKNTPYITLDEEGLRDLLMGRTPKPYTRKIKDFTFRY